MNDGTSYKANGIDIQLGHLANIKLTTAQDIWQADGQVHQEVLTNSLSEPSLSFANFFLKEKGDVNLNTIVSHLQQAT